MSTRRAKKVKRKKIKAKTKKHFPKTTDGGGNAEEQEQRQSVAADIDRVIKPQIINLVINESDDSKKIIKNIRSLYEEIVSRISTANKNNRIQLNEKNIINNFIEYAESANFKKIAEGKNTANWNQRREMFIDQFMRFNTKPYFDPYLERIVSTFWPEFDSIKFKPSNSKILKKSTKFVSDFYDNVPIYDNKLKDDNKKQKLGTYSHRVLRQTDDYKGDKLLTDAFGVEDTINMLMQTGSNLSWAETRLPTYTEEYEQNEKYDVSKMIPPPSVDKDR